MTKVAVTLSLFVSFSLLIMCGIVVASSKSAVDHELEELISSYRYSTEVKKIIQQIKWSGITDNQIFRLIEKDLLTVEIGSRSPGNTENISWLIQGLAYSGNTEFQYLIESFLSSPVKKIKRNARSSLILLPKFEKWNPVISSGLEGLSRSELNTKRIQNMLAATDPELVRAGVSRVYHEEHRNNFLMSMIAKDLAGSYKESRVSFRETDLISWYCKALGRSNNPAHLPLLKEVHEQTKSDRVRNWAEIAIKDLGGSVVDQFDEDVYW